MENSAIQVTREHANASDCDSPAQPIVNLGVTQERANAGDCDILVKISSH
jgi:hypothetical protein